jgi:uncharacterized protein
MSFPLLLLLLMIVAFLYASVGHGGASGYLAVMALLGVAPSLMKSSALVMNLAVSLISFWGFYRAGFFRFKLFLPFALGSIPLSFLGATYTLPDAIYKKILAVCILISLARLFYQVKEAETSSLRPVSWGAGLTSGGIIGLISGMIGIGGGIILSPLMLLFRWATIKETAAISAMFIFVNSVAGILGAMAKGTLLLSTDILWAVCATIVGGLGGAYMGSHHFNVPTLKYFLGVSLLIACLKLIFT